MNDIPFDLEACREHSLEARQAGIYIHNLFCNDEHEDAMKLIEAVKQRQVGNTFHAILAEVPPCSLRKLINRSPPRMYSEELIVRSFLRQEYDAKARRLMLADQRPWRGLYDASFNSILPPAQHAPLSAPIFLDYPPQPELQNYLELVKDKLFYKDMLRFVRDYNMFNSKASPTLQLWDDALVDVEYGHLTLIMNEEKAMKNTLRRKLEKDRREGTTKNRYRRSEYQKNRYYRGFLRHTNRKCNEGHGLIRFNTTHDDVTCDLCEKNISKDNVMYGCNSECDFDICTSCGGNGSERQQVGKYSRGPSAWVDDQGQFELDSNSKAAWDADWTPAEIDTQVEADLNYWRNEKAAEKERTGAGKGEALAVCDNKLFFKISLDAYCGYEVEGKFDFGIGSEFHGQAAVMGGAVLAALTAQRGTVVERYTVGDNGTVVVRGKNPEGRYFVRNQGVAAPLFASFAEYLEIASADILLKLASDTSNDDDIAKMLNGYNELRDELTNNLHQFFLSDESNFKSGDVDLFIAQTASNSSSSSSNSSSNKEVAGGSFKNFAEQGVNRLKEHTDGYGGNNRNAGWTFCKTASVLSLYYAPGQKQRRWSKPSSLAEVEAIQRWPRMTQLIELDKRAGLIDALLDFDIDAAACMWDGSNVIALPRAIQALATKTLICRPGILQHSRNRARLSKYGRRGFSSRLLDPLCRHNDEAGGIDGKVESNESGVNKGHGSHSNGCRHADLCALFKPRTHNPGLSRPARYISNNNHGLTWSFQACCQLSKTTGGKYWSESCCHLKLELIPGDAQRFFALRYKWTSAQIAEVAAKDPKSLWACGGCKGDYRLARFPEVQWGKTKDGDQEAPEDGDLATEVGAMHISNSENFGGDSFVHADITMYWYGAGVFPKGPSRRGVNYGIYEIRGRMTTQARVDQVRYLRDNNQSLDGYQSRFVFACSLEEVFQKEERQELRKPTRPPIGLNPERFAIQCIKCEAYVYRAEHLDAGSIVCATCQNYKGSR